MLSSWFRREEKAYYCRSIFKMVCIILICIMLLLFVCGCLGSFKR